VVFIGVTALMHGTVVYSALKNAPDTEEPVYASAT
jgi:hypothetical protein